MRAWLGKLFSADSSASFGRMAAAFVLLAGLAWGTYIVIKRLEIPSLEGVAAMVASLYGGSKIGECIQTLAKGTEGKEKDGH